MVAKPFDLEKHPPPDYGDKLGSKKDPGNALSPDREVLEEHFRVNFPYEESFQDRNYREFYKLAIVSKHPVMYDITQMYRRKLSSSKGEFIEYAIRLKGTKWDENEIGYDILKGFYRKPIWRYERNPETAETTVKEIRDHEVVYTTPWSKEKFDELMEAGADTVNLYLISPSGKRFGLINQDDFRNGSFDDLLKPFIMPQVTAVSGSPIGATTKKQQQ